MLKDKGPHTTQKLWLLLLGSIAFRLFFIWYFGDIDFEPDSYLHFIYSVSSFARLPESLNYAAQVWAKPLFTLLTGLIIWISGVRALWIVKVLNTLVWGSIGLLIYQLARRLKLSTGASLISVFLAEFSFLGFRSSIGTLTEPLFTVIVLAAIVSLYDKWYTISCLLASLSVLARSEGLVLLPAWVAILWLVHGRRRFLDFLLLAVLPLLWNLWGYLLSGDPAFILTSGYPIATSPYGHGGWFDYPLGLLQYEPLAFPLAVLGAGLTMRKRRYRPLHILLAFFFGFNVIAWRFGLFGTAGLLRYFVPIVPWLALYAAAAFDFTGLLPTYKRLAARGLNFLFLQVVFTVLVLNSHTEGYNLYNTPTVHHALIEAGEWIKANRPEDYVYSSHPALLYYAGRDFYSGAMETGAAGIQQDGIVAFEGGFGSAEMLEYLEHFPLLEEFGNYLLIYDHNLTAIKVRPEMPFGTDDIQPHLQGGWSTPEGWGTWATGTQSEFILYSPAPQDVSVTLSVIPHFFDERRQSIKVYYNDVLVGGYWFPKGDQGVQRFSFNVPGSLMSGKVDVTRFVFEYAISPSDLGMSNDGRQLSVGFLQMSVAPEARAIEP
jgi:hypothetical protein